MEIYFEVISCLRRRIRITRSHWELVTRRKHPEIAGLEREVQSTLIEAEAVRVSQDNEHVFLYYRRFREYQMCVVCRH